MSTPSTNPSSLPPTSPSAEPSDSASEPGQPVIDALGQAVEGLTFTSETDAPLTPFFWPAPAAGTEAEVSAQNLARLAELPPESKIEQQSVDEFLAPAVAEEDWQDESERATARRFQALALVLREHLGDACAFRVGETSIDVYIVGRAQGGLAGLQTKVVET